MNNRPLTTTSAQELMRFENEKIVTPLALQFLRKTRPIYLVPTGRPETEITTIGSCFFLRFLNRAFVVTASHVAKEAQNGILYLTTASTIVESAAATSIESIPSPVFHTGDWSRHEDEDEIDLAFAELPEGRAKRFPAEAFFTMSEWDTDDRPHPQSHYLICGWPAKRNQPNPRKVRKLPRSPISYRDASHPASYYDRHGWSRDVHYAIEFSPKRAIDGGHKLTIPPHMRGLSGSPCLFFHRYRTRDDLLAIRSPKLVGIAISIQKDALIATRVSVLLDLLKKHCRSSA